MTCRRVASASFVLAALLLASLLASGSLAQEPPRRDPQAIALLTSAVGAMRAGALASQQSDAITVQADGTYTQFDQAVPASRQFRLKIFGLSRIRWEMQRSDGTDVLLIVKGNAWSTNRTGTRQLPVGSPAGRRLETVPSLVLVDWLTSSQVALTYQGLETVEGRSLHHISAYRVEVGDSQEFKRATEQMSRFELYLDEKTLLPARLRYDEHPGDWRVNIPMDLVYSDYQHVGVLYLPATVTRLLRGQRVDEYKFQSFAVGAPVPTSDFALR